MNKQHEAFLQIIIKNKDKVEKKIEGKENKIRRIYSNVLITSFKKK